MAALLVCAVLASSSRAIAIDLNGTAWEEAAAQAGVADPLLLYAISLVEAGRSAGHGRIAPWPWTVRTPDGPVFAATREEAETLLRRLPRDSNSDVGLMQVNWRAHGHRVRSAEELLDPAQNLRIAASILRHAMASVPFDPVLGVGRYHSWTEWRAREYGTLVWATYYGLAGLRRVAEVSR